jgi:hypothetical protein
MNSTNQHCACLPDCLLQAGSDGDEAASAGGYDSNDEMEDDAGEVRRGCEGAVTGCGRQTAGRELKGAAVTAGAQHVYEALHWSSLHANLHQTATYGPPKPC